MLRLKLKSFLRQHHVSESELADAITDALLASGESVSDRYLRYLTQNTEVITPENDGKKPSLLKLGFIIKGLRALTGSPVSVSDVLEYVPDEAEVLAPAAVLVGEAHVPPYDLVPTAHEDDETLEQLWLAVTARLKESGQLPLYEVIPPYVGKEVSRSPQRKPLSVGMLLALLVAALGYIGYSHLVLQPQQYERFTRLISFRDRVRPTSVLSVPTLIGPEGEVSQLTPVLRVSEVVGALAYEFYVENLISQDGAYSGPVPNSSFPVPKDTLCPDTTYEWRARALGEDGWTSFSSPVQFKVARSAASASTLDVLRLTAIRSKSATPLVLSPIGTTNTVTPALEVSHDPDVYGYGFYIRDLQTDKIVYDNNFATENKIRVPSGVLEDGGVYQWNARARNCHYWSDFTPAQIFTVNARD